MIEHYLLINKKVLAFHEDESELNWEREKLYHILIFKWFWYKRENLFALQGALSCPVEQGKEENF
jgi:hypothetical protein